MAANLTVEGAVQVKSFVSEGELEERKKRRQIEWEKVRQPDQPLECPEEQHDHRSLFDRLQEQKDRKQAEYEEQHKLKNMIRGLDDEEVQFLDLVDQTKAEIDNQRLKEEYAEIKEYRQAVANLASENATKHIAEKKKPLQNTNNNKKSQQVLLAGAVKRKSSDNVENNEKKRKLSDTESHDCCLHVSDQKDSSNNSVDGFTSKSNHESCCREDSLSSSKSVEYNSPGTKCVAILPGLGAYTDSSDSYTSSSELEEETDFDILGRRKLPKCLQQH